jgi:cytochrome bd-type quinol oxidase subunit 2
MTYTTASLPLSYDISSREINSFLSCIHIVFDLIGIGSPAKFKNCSWPWMFCTQLISCIFQMMGTAHCNVQKSGAPVLFVLLLFLIWLVDVGTVHYPDSKCTHHPIHCCLLCCVSAAIALQMRYILHFWAMGCELLIYDVYRHLRRMWRIRWCVCIMANDVWSLCLVHSLP